MAIALAAYVQRTTSHLALYQIGRRLLSTVSQAKKILKEKEEVGKRLRKITELIEQKELEIVLLKKDLRF